MTEELTTREAFEQVTTASLVAIGEVARQSPYLASNPGLLSLISVALPTFGLAIGRRLHKAYAARLPTFTQGYANAFDGDPDRVKRHASEHEDDEDYHETMYRSFRAMLDAAVPEVVESLGYLAGKYTLAGKKPDSFFRGLGRVLCDLDASEFGALKALLIEIRDVNAALDTPETWLDLVIDSQMVEGSERVVSREEHGTLATWDTEIDVRLVHSSDTFSSIGKHTAAPRLFILLKREGLAENNSFSENPKRERGFPTGDLAMFISDDIVRQILSIIAPACVSS